MKSSPPARPPAALFRGQLRSLYAKRSLRALLGLACLALFPLGCATAAKRLPDASAEEARLRELGAKAARAMDLGRELATADPLFVERLEDEVLAETLRVFFSPMAGARRLLSFRDQRPEDPLNSVFLEKQDEKGRFFAIEDEEAFRAGNFFNSYDKALFQPFFRQILLEHLQRTQSSESDLIRMAKGLKMAAAFTPRYAGFYPNHVLPELRKVCEAYLKEFPEGPLSDRLRFLLWWDERNGAWARGRAKLNARMKELKESTRDELLKLEIQDALNVQGLAPERAFWMSLALPGLGQVANGDLQGGLLLGGLTAAAWVWLVSKLGAAQVAPTEQARQVARGDAAWAGGLVALGHLFTAYNAAEQARFINIMIEWDILSRPRLKP